MHKNTYTAKTLIGNWQEERSTEAFENFNEVANCYLPNPSYNKFIPISKEIGNQKEYKKVGVPFCNFIFSNHSTTPPRTG